MLPAFPLNTIILIITIYLTQSSQNQTNQIQKRETPFQSEHNTSLNQKNKLISRLLTTCDIGCLTCSSYDSSRCLSCINDTYWHDSWKKDCNLCSTTISDCATCSTNFQGVYCTLCSDNTVYLSKGSCLTCSSAMDNCITCSSSSQCLTCLNDLYYVDLDGECHICSDHVSNCLTCESDLSLTNFNCTGCESQAYFLNSTGLCESCQADIAFCVSCTNRSYCLRCINNSYAYQQTANTCVLCPSLFDNCSLCTQTSCTRCQQGFALTSRNTCECPVGKLVAGLCTTIIGCIEPVKYPDGSKGCLTCNQSDFEKYPVNGKCNCSVGQLVGQLCVDIIGCIAAKEEPNGNIVCITCNTPANFNKQPNQQGLCECASHTLLSGKTCVDICGDGLLIGKTYTCDDGNRINGDGCSSQCSVQIDYRCQNGSSTTPSECTYIGRPLQFSLSSIKKADSNNQGIFVFSVSPGISNFGKMDLTRYVSLVCNSTYTISSISYSQGKLTIVADYTEDMEGRMCFLSIKFQRKYIVSPDSLKQFQAVSDNFPLVIIEDGAKIESLGMFLYILSFMVVGLFLATLPHKMIGPELLVACQMVYLSSCLYKKPSLFSLVINKFNLVTGGWSLLVQEGDEDMVPCFTDRMQISPVFLQSTIVIISIILLSWIGWSILMGYSGHINLGSTSSKNLFKYKKYSKTDKATKLLYYMLLYPTTSGFFIVLSLAGFLNNLRTNYSSQRFFNSSINSIFLFLAWLAIGTVLFIQFTDLKAKQLNHLKLSGLQNVKYWYIPLFLIRSVCIIVFLEVGVTQGSFAAIIYPILALNLIYTIIIIVGRPYQRTICNLTLVIGEFTAIISIVLPFLQSYINVPQNLQILLIYSLLVLISLTILFTLFRLALLYHFIVSHFCLNKDTILCSRPEPPQLKPKIQQEVQQQKNTKRKNPYSIYTPEDQKYVGKRQDDIDSVVKSNLLRIIEPFENALHSILIPKESQDNIQLRQIKNRLRQDLLIKKAKKGVTSLQME